MTRRRIAVVLVVVLAWCTAGAWASLGHGPAGGAVIAAAERSDHGPALLSRAAAGETLTHLSRHPLAGALAVAAPTTRTTGAARRRH